MKHYTSIEQSIKLLELGLSPETADMLYNEEPDETYHKDIVDTKYPMIIREGQKPYLEEYGIPCWSLSALLEVMPYINDSFSNCKPTLTKNFCKRISYQCSYIRESVPGCAIASFINDTPIEAAFNMVVWLLENNYTNRINNGKA